MTNTFGSQSAELELHFREGETIHTENSYKFTDNTLDALLSDSGFKIESTWKDGRNWYAVTLSRRLDGSVRLKVNVTGVNAEEQR